MTHYESTDDELDSRLRTRLRALDDRLADADAALAIPVRRSDPPRRPQSVGTLLAGLVLVGAVAAVASVYRPTSNVAAPLEGAAIDAPSVTVKPGTQITAAVAEALAREHVQPGATFVASTSGRFEDVFEPLGEGTRLDESSVAADAMVWVVTFTQVMDICSPPYVVDGKTEQNCLPPRQATVRVILDLKTGAYLAATGFAPAD